MLFASSKSIVLPQDLIRLYLHEAERTYSDKLIHLDDLELFQKIARETIRKSFDVCFADLTGVDSSRRRRSSSLMTLSGDR
jgi:AAA+ lid domain